MNKYVCINLTLMLQRGVVWLCLSFMAFGRAVASINSSQMKYQASQDTVYMPVSALYLTM